MLTIAQDFVHAATKADSDEALFQIMADSSTALGFRYFALTHHIDFRRDPDAGVRLHNYPSSWAADFQNERLGPSDPVLRASVLTSIGFAWAELDRLIQLTANDREFLERAQREGIGDGFTVPAHVPGDANGSCSFATAAGETANEDVLPVAQLIGGFAFEAARTLWRQRITESGPTAKLTDRQRDCVLLVARGKTDWEIAQILGVSQDTIAQHLKQARERYGVQTRTLLAVRALFDGTISFTEVFGR